MKSSLLFQTSRRGGYLVFRHRQFKYSTTTTSVGDGGGSSQGQGSPANATLTGSEFPKAYEPTLFEEAWNSKWLKRTSLDRKDSPVFRMILPPPNVTGKLHLGHALTIAIQDTIARWKTMQGYKLEWIPGFDHAGIATHTIALRKLKIEHSTLGPGDFLRERIQDIASINLDSIQKQITSLGALLNWESVYYTLDESHSNVVKEAFFQLFEAGLIQRGDGIVNWSCCLQSSISDVEVDHVDFTGKMIFKVPNHDDPVEFGVLYNLAYGLENSDQSLLVATSRPETLFGDVALAVNPLDSRFAHLIGKNAINPVNDKVLPIIGDPRVKTNFGTGVVKITPAHDKLDFAIGASHNLPKLDVITGDGFLNDLAGNYKGIPRLSARSIVLEALDKKGALKSVQEYAGVINICSRTGDVVEPKVLPHWFLKTEKLTKFFIDSIKSEDFIISPKNYGVDLLNTLSNCQDWCLSRQISWGHEIPVYRFIDHPEGWVVALDLQTAKKKIEAKYNITINDESTIIQDSDVLDTWFSSSLIPVALSGWPDFKEIKEISLMETGRDILLYWVWRMVIITIALTNQFPFKHVLLHGIISDKYGRKMSKSKGNVIDPLHVVNGICYLDLLEEAKKSLEQGDLERNEYDLRIEAIDSDYPQGFKAFGRDALRFALLSQNVQGEQLGLDMVYLENCRHFTNKLWQALRFFLLYRENVEKTTGNCKPLDVMSITSKADLWLLSCLYEFMSDVEQCLDSGQFHSYAESIRKFFYRQLCDVYIELIKNDLKAGVDKSQHLLVLEYAISTGLKLSHPLIPFVTEEMWSRLFQAGLLIDEPFPKSKELESFHNAELNRAVLKTLKLAKEIRSLKTRIGMKAKSTPLVYIDAIPSQVPEIGSMKSYIENLAGCKLTCRSLPPLERSNFITVIIQLDGQICKISTPKGEATEKYLEGENNKILKLQVRLAKLKHQYENPNFQQHASQEVKEKLRKRLETLELQINEVVSSNPSENTRNPS